jgi:fibronectin-binding autotransporter adhesin
VQEPGLRQANAGTELPTEASSEPPPFPELKFLTLNSRIMKIRTMNHKITFVAFTTFAVSLLGSLPASAAIFYWDSNAGAAGFGNTTGTWGTSNFLNASSDGLGTTFSTTTTTADELRFGFSENYGNASVSIAAGGVSINAISFRGGQTTGITIGTTSNTITLGGTTPTISNFNNSTVHNIAAVLAGSGVALTKSEVGLIALSGANTYDGGTTISGGTLVFRNVASKASAGTHAFSAGTVLGLGVGGTGFFSTSDFENARAGTMTGNLAGITLDAATAVGLDTTTGNLSYATAITGSRGFAKLGENSLTLGNSNSYTGATTLQGGTLNVASLANAGANSSIGNFAAAGAAGLLLRGGVFNFTGTGPVATDRGFTASGQLNTIQVGANTNLTLGDSAVTTTGSTQALAFNHGAGSSITISKVVIPNHKEVSQRSLKF